MIAPLPLLGSPEIYWKKGLALPTFHKLRFGYADDLNMYHVGRDLEQTTRALEKEVQELLDWGDENKVVFAPEKYELMHFTRKRDAGSPTAIIGDLRIEPAKETATDKLPALRWLGIWFDRRLTWRKHVSVRAAKARVVAYHIRSLARTTYGPPASALRKATLTCVYPSLLYGSEVWYGGVTKPGRHARDGEVKSRVGWHRDTLDKTLTLAARGALPVWRTTPTVSLYRDLGLPLAIAALEESRLRFALRLKLVDKDHLLAKRANPPLIHHGRGTGTRQRPKIKV
ncbi:hypothetical protein N7454_008183 [Penicillium verhagenii]|nr:hypothetical protein N7454_008183 [Penicillium verhagenii]